MQSLPAEIGNLRNLQNLNLSYNQLQSLPAEIGNLINLKKLDLAINKLQSLPAEIGNLINLEKLDLYFNELCGLPNTILLIKKSLLIGTSSYDFNNIFFQNEILIFTYLKKGITNLPFNTKEIWLKKDINEHPLIYLEDINEYGLIKDIKECKFKLPFDCKIIYF